MLVPSKTALKRKNPAANDGFCYGGELLQLQPEGEASHLRTPPRPDENRHVIEDAHKRSISQTKHYRSEVVGCRNKNADSHQPSTPGAMSANAVATVPIVLRRRPRN